MTHLESQEVNQCLLIKQENQELNVSQSLPSITTHHLTTPNQNKHCMSLLALLPLSTTALNFIVNWCWCGVHLSVLHALCRVQTTQESAWSVASSFVLTMHLLLHELSAHYTPRLTRFAVLLCCCWGIYTADKDHSLMRNVEHVNIVNRTRTGAKLPSQIHEIIRVLIQMIFSFPRRDHSPPLCFGFWARGGVGKVVSAKMYDVAFSAIMFWFWARDSRQNNVPWGKMAHVKAVVGIKCRYFRASII